MGRLFLSLAGLAAFMSWVGYVRLMTTENYPPSVASDAMLVVGLLIWSVCFFIRDRGGK